MSLANWSSVSDLGQLPAVANQTSGGTFWIGMLQMLWVILILLLIDYGFEVALLVSSFLALILALILYYAGLISWVYIIQFTGIILFMFLYIAWSSERK